jgi:predicted nucleic acid-binding protein
MSDFASFSIVPFGTNTPFPQEELYPDANAWVDIALKQKSWRITEKFLMKFVGINANNYLLWSQHTTDEVLRCIEVDEYIKEASLRNITGIGNKRPYKVLEDQIDPASKLILENKVLQQYDLIRQKLDDVVYPIDPYDVMPTTRKIMSTYAVPFKDAKHLAYMWHEGTNNLYTNDTRLTPVPGLNIYSIAFGANGNSPFPISSFMPELTPP